MHAQLFAILLLMSFDHQKIERKWQKYWEKEGLYRAEDFGKKKKQYVLIEFPYPSGERLHVGHGRSYCCFDAVARLKRMQGDNVLFPIGWDAFGLPAENYAIRTGIHPAETTRENIQSAKQQAQSWGLSFDWSREITTTDPAYYKWTQWIFLQLFKKGLAYKKEIPVNWCPKDKINLANEEVIQGACERCGTRVERRMQSQWLLKITEYADRLLDDLDKVDYRKDIRDQQINWIGRSEGARIKFPLRGVPGQPAVEVFTTRADTLFGATFLVISPELAQQWIGRGWSAPAKVSSYVQKTLNRPELERQKEKTGVSAEINARHPLTGDEIPVWISSYVLAGYGTGAVMGVPAHDQRDLEFAQKFDLPIQEVIQNKPESNFPKEAFEGEGTLINSGDFDGLDSRAAADKITGRLEKEDLGAPAVDYKLRDWVFSRQHYWGEPIPIIICEEHGFVPVPEENLPVELPYVKKFQPTDTGESPLAGVKDWVKVDCPTCGKQARRETDTMPNWAGSSWYFLRYLDPENRQQFADRKKLDYWMPVDWYNGGMEHTNLHLLYSRFWYKVMADLKLVPGEEPYAKRTSHGVVLGPDGQKMSKSRGNVVNPDEVVAEFGADAFRLYEAFIGPFEQMIPWDPRGILGVRRFLDKVWKAHQEITAQEAGVGSEELERALHRLIKKVEEDTLTLNFNTAVSAMMEFVNLLSSQEYRLTIDAWKTFLKVLAPYAPHLGEELYQNLVKGDKKSVHLEAWPKFDSKLIEEETVTVIVQVDGKFRGKFDFQRGATEAATVKEAQKLEVVKPHLHGRKVAKTVFVPDNLVNFVTA